jgi:hypothetical protein
MDIGVYTMFLKCMMCKSTFVSNWQSKMNISLNISLCIFNLSPPPLENAVGDGFLMLTLLEVGEAACGEVGVRDHREG